MGQKEEGDYKGNPILYKGNPVLNGDYKIILKNNGYYKNTEICHLSFNTAMIQDNTLKLFIE